MKIRAIVVVLGAAACTATPSEGVRPLPCPAGGLPAANATIGYEPPQPRAFFTPPLPPPRAMLGQRAVFQVLVDSTGVAVKDSIRICGVDDSAYATRIAQNITALPFTPGRQDGRPVRAYAFLRYDF